MSPKFIEAKVGVCWLSISLIGKKKKYIQTANQIDDCNITFKSFLW